MTQVLPVWIGFDQREAEAADVCAMSIRRRASEAVHIRMLDERTLRYIGLFNRTWHAEGTQRIDDRDGRPFSTAFTFTRFMVPALQCYDGWALYCDCDFLFTADIAGLFALADPRFAVQVVKHDHVSRESLKMDGQRQTDYHRKNWSSAILWNCAHPSNKFLTVRAVNHESGQWLHAFGWLRDDEIGDLPPTWNWLAGVNEPLDEIPCAVHYTLGTPNMSGHEQTPLAQLWLNERLARRGLVGPLPTERLRAIG